MHSLTSLSSWLRGIVTAPRFHPPTTRKLTFERLEERLLLAAPDPFDLSSLDGADGTKFAGVATNVQQGKAVSAAGDFNGDGFDDLIIAAPESDEGALNNRGAVYVVLGKAAGFGADFDVGSLTTGQGFKFLGTTAGETAGYAVAGGGDINGDGFDDVVIGAPVRDTGGTNRGAVYIIFGRPTASIPAEILASSLDGTSDDGFVIQGANNGDQLGFSVGIAGDFNGDGFDEVIVGTPKFDGASGNDRGAAYLIFGKASGFTNTLDLNSPDGTNFVEFVGIDPTDEAGTSVSGAGDVDGDGFDDIVIGAQYAAKTGSGPKGEAYVFFGNNAQPATTSLSPGVGEGLIITGQAEANRLGRSVGAAGDVNGDGFDDVIVGAPRFGNNDPGAAYIVFGKMRVDFPANFDLANIDGVNGVRLRSNVDNSSAGFSVGGAGDINGDGFDDVIVGAPLAFVYNGGSGYVVFGQADFGVDTFSLSDDINGTNGIKLPSENQDDRAGRSVAIVGDVNGDGFDDFLLGAHKAGTDVGAAYLIFGDDFGLLTAAQVGEGLTGGGPDGVDSFTGVNGAGAPRDILIGGLENDTLTSDGGDDILRGAEGDDVLQIPDTTFSGRRVQGGNGIDSLRLLGGGLHLNLIEIGDTRIQDVEIIDISGSGDNSLTLNLREVLNLSSHSNNLTVLRNVGDVVDLVDVGDGWTSAGKIFDGQFFDVFTQGAATLRVQDPTVIIDGDIAAVTGTGGDDFFMYGVVSRLAVVNGVAYLIPAGVNLVEFDGLAGNDRFDLTGTSGDESALTRPKQVFLEHDSSHVGFDVTGVDMETVILDGKGGNDTVTLRDTVGNVNETLFARPKINNALLFANDGSYFSSVFGFQVTTLFSDGNDRALFFDSPAVEVAIIRPGNASLSSQGLLTNVQSFDTFLARSTSGNDIANVFGTVATDLFTGRNGFGVMTAGGQDLLIDSYATINANGLTGDDLVRFNGGPGDDLLVAGPNFFSFTTGVSALNAASFETLISDARTGEKDRAILTGSTGDDSFIGSPDFGQLRGLGYLLRTFKFDRITIHGLAGVNTISDNGINYTLNPVGNWV